MKNDLQLPLSIKLFASWQYWIVLIFLIVWLVGWLSIGVPMAMESDDLSEWLVLITGIIIGSYRLILISTAKVMLYDFKIDYESFFKKTSINWPDVKTFGGYYETRQFITMISESELRTKSIFDANKNLFVSTTPKFRPRKWSFISSNFISFPYSPEIYDFVSEKVKV